MRIGRGLPNWLSEGETLWMGTDGKSVFVIKSSLPIIGSDDVEQIEQATEQLGRFLDPRKVMERAKASAGLPGKRETVSTTFERSVWVREFARQRSGGKCEIPGCNYVGFIKFNGEKYIEVHHFPAHKLRMLAAKTTCKDRWRQVINEAERIETKHLLTLQEGISVGQFKEMTEAKVQLVVPLPLVQAYPKSVQPHLQTLAGFIAELQHLRVS